MRVVVNQLASLRQKTGIGHYTDELLHWLRQEVQDDQVDGYPLGWVRRGCEVLTGAVSFLRNTSTPPTTFSGQQGRLSGGVKQEVLRRLRHGGKDLVARHFRFACSPKRYDLYHEPNFIPFPSDLPTVSTLHDLSVVLYPEWHPVDRVVYFEKHFHRALKQSVHFLTDTDSVRREVIHALGIPPGRVTRVYNGIRSSFRRLSPLAVAACLKDLDLPRSFLLYVGTIEPRKNVSLLLRAYCSLPNHLRESWPLVLVGPWGWQAEEVASYLNSTGRHRGIVHLGYVPDHQLAALYNAARALVYPSHYEGFGFPPLEMMACGGAVLASTADALVETIGRKAHLVPSDDFDGWRNSLARVLTDDDWWRALRKNAQSVALPYTWERCATETLDVYRSLCGATVLEPKPIKLLAA